LPRQKIDIEGEISIGELFQIGPKNITLRNVVGGLVKDAAKTDDIGSRDPVEPGVEPVLVLWPRIGDHADNLRFGIGDHVEHRVAHALLVDWHTDHLDAE